MNSTKILLLLSLVFLFLVTPQASAENRVTNVRVIAHEYYDYYALPDAKKWRQVTGIRIDGQNIGGSINAVASGPAGNLELVLYDVGVPSEYWITVYWDDGEKLFESHTSSSTSEVIHQIYAPW